MNLNFKQLFFAMLCVAWFFLPTSAKASCEDAAKQFVLAARSEMPLPLLVDQVMKEAKAEIDRRRAPLVLDRSKVQASVERAMAIWKESASEDKVKDYFVAQCKGMLIHWC